MPTVDFSWITHSSSHSSRSGSRHVAEKPPCRTSLFGVRTPVKTPYAAPNSVEERPPLISEGHTISNFGHKIDFSRF